MISQRQTITGIQGDMMSAYANSVQPKPERFDMYVRKFRSICSMHGVEIGSRMELPGFQQKLMQDRHLAMDFWAFVGKLSDREGGDLSDDQILGVVVEGVTDGEISEIDGGQKRIVDDLRAMLAGVDIQGTEHSHVEMAPFPRSEAISSRGDGQRWTHVAESSIGLSDSPLAITSERVDGDVDHAAVLPAMPSPQLDEARLRLELTRLVQQYFDNIDKRISKLEPYEEGVAPSGTIATAVTRRSLEEPASKEEMEELRLRRMGRTRLVLEPIALPTEHSLATNLPIHIPLEHYSPPTTYGKAPLLLVLVLLGASFALYRDPTLLRQGFAAIVRQFRSDGALAPVPKPRALLPNPPGQNASVNTQSQPSATQAVQSTSTPPPADTSNQTAPVEPKVSGNNLDSNNNRMTARALVQAAQGLADGISSVEAAGAVRVNPSVMDRNLIVSRVPAYPEFAKMNRIEGHVVMQALISKDGTVKRVHVTEGDSRLRSAAEEAVYKWRYRPYVLNGQPVEVATTVTVNFDLNR